MKTHKTQRNYLEHEELATIKKVVVSVWFLRRKFVDLPGFICFLSHPFFILSKIFALQFDYLCLTKSTVATPLPEKERVRSPAAHGKSDFSVCEI
jgi:hypothetical protein